DEDVAIESMASCMRLAMDSIRRAAQSDLLVMLRGENGIGKTVVAECLHRHSHRSSHPFVTVNCPSLSAELAASDLFGHRRGAFTGAVADQLGKVEAAQGGSLFLDELGDLPLGVQARILRFLQDQAYERLGETITRYGDVRLITATNRDLEGLIANGSFRPDLFYRLSGIEITIPPLRDRRGDIVVLARKFLRDHGAAHGRSLEFAPAILDVLASYDWPGNVRELSNEIQRAVVMTADAVITPEDLSSRLLASSSGNVYLGGEFTLQQVADEHVSRVLKRHQRVGQVARVLDIERSTLLTKRRRLGVRPSRSSAH
ncbi:MAG TPA: sigma-54 dependent transcriptional regulator, partial [Planctomycetota bacterium]|nr:sigma-54 dependent transcriptional regulator [Planctomycetota bacterium]